MKKRLAASPFCPCGLPQSYAQCCGRYIEDPATPAPTAQALMRSRYTAYARQAIDYLLLTWHVDTRPPRETLAQQEPGLKWLGLEVVGCVAGLPGDQDGVVEFVARYKLGGRAQRMHEVSHFVSQDGRWYYRDGEMRD